MRIYVLWSRVSHVLLGCQYDLKRLGYNFSLTWQLRSKSLPKLLADGICKNVNLIEVSLGRCC